MLLRKSFETTQKQETPTSDDMAMINRYALKAMSPDEVFVGREFLCNDQKDRAHEKFPLGYLKRFEETLPGKSVLEGHDYTKSPAGRYFDAEVVPHEGQQKLLARYYLLKGDPLTAKVEAGIAGYKSIGFQADKRFCDLCSRDYDGAKSGAPREECCPHIAGKEYDGQVCSLTYGGDLSKVEAVEGSFVYLGCQYGAETIRGDAFTPATKAAFFDAHSNSNSFDVSGTPRWEVGLDFDSSTGTKEHRMPPEDTQGKAPALGADREKELLLEIDALKAWKTEHEPLVADGKAYREFLLAETKRKYAACEMEQTGIAIVESLADAPIEKLKKAEADASKLFNAKLGPTANGVPADPKDPSTPPPADRPRWRPSHATTPRS